MKLAVALLLPALALGQNNLDFQNGIPGQAPPGWFVLDAVKDSGYSIAWRQQDCHGGSSCVLMSAPASPPPQSFGTLMQSFSAQTFRGKKVRLRAWIRVEGKAPGDRAQMLLHIGRPNGQPAFVDNMADRPITPAEWRQYEIQGDVPVDADSIRIGVLLYGVGRAFVSEVEFNSLAEETSGPAVDAALAAIQKQYARMDAAFVRGDIAEIGAVLMPDAQMGAGTIREPLLPAIEGEIAKGSKLTAQTAVASVKLMGDEAIAIVRREAKDVLTGGRRSVVTSHRDTWIQTATGWRCKESIEVSYHWILPPTAADAARAAAADLKKRATGLAGSVDLAPFGAALGDARIVVLGEAAHGVREFLQWKQRIVEYLVEKHGFTAVAAAKEEDVHDLVARLHVEYLPLNAVATSQAKMVVWTDNARAREASLRNRFGRKLYSVGFAFRRGEVRAVGVEGGESRGLNVYTAGPSAEGTGDAVLSEAGLPQFFLNIAGVPGSSALGRWLAESHLFHDLGAYWVIDDPDASLQPVELSKSYDGLIFVEEIHAGG